MKILKAQKHPDTIDNELLEIPLTEIKYIAGENWLRKKMVKYDYENSFKNAGMVFPITTVNTKDYWQQHRMTNGVGLYVVTGHKRVLWAKENGYTHIEGYTVDNQQDFATIRAKTKISHEDIPK